MAKIQRKAGVGPKYGNRGGRAKPNTGASANRKPKRKKPMRQRKPGGPGG